MSLPTFSTWVGEISLWALAILPNLATFSEKTRGGAAGDAFRALLNLILLF